MRWGQSLGAGRLSFASPERLQKHLGLLPGAVSLLGLVNDPSGAVEFVIDRSLWDADAVQAHPLVNTATMVIPHAESRALSVSDRAPSTSGRAAGGSRGVMRDD